MWIKSLLVKGGKKDYIVRNIYPFWLPTAGTIFLASNPCERGSGIR